MEQGAPKFENETKQECLQYKHSCRSKKFCSTHSVCQATHKIVLYGPVTTLALRSLRPSCPNDSGSLQVGFRGRSTSNEIIDLGLKERACCTKLFQIGLQIGLLLLLRVDHKCQVAELRLHKSGKLPMNCVSFHSFSPDLRLTIREGLDTLFKQRAPKLQRNQTKVFALRTHVQTKNICSTRNVCFVLMVAKALLHLWYNITAVHETQTHVLSVARIALHCHGGALEDNHGCLCRRRLVGILD